MGKGGVMFQSNPNTQLQQTQSSCESPRLSARDSLMALDNLHIPKTIKNIKDVHSERRNQTQVMKQNKNDIWTTKNINNRRQSAVVFGECKQLSV